MFVWIGWRLTVWAVLLVLSGLLVMLVPALAPWGVMIALCGAIRPWLSAWKGALGTALRGALVWAGLTIALGLLAQVQALFELPETGRPWTGRITYLMVLAMLASLTSVLGARNPGGRAWAILMVLLVVVFLIPWLEAGGRLRRPQGLGQVQLDSPWTLFYGLLVLAGVTNFLPTRYGLAALSLGAGLVLEFLGLTRHGLDGRGSRRSLVDRGVVAGPWLVACGVVESAAIARAKFSGTALALVPGPLGRRLGAEDPGAVQPVRRAFPLAGSSDLVRPGAGVPSDNSRACGVARTGRGSASWLDPPVRGGRAC